MIGLYIFRRDFRIVDNPGLYLLSKKCDKILPLFILDPNQLNTSYFSSHSYDFMINCLYDLNKSYLDNKLLVQSGDVIKILDKLKKKIDYSYIGYNSDWSEYSILRDNLIDEFCVLNNINIIKYESEIFLNDSYLYLKKDKSPYLVYSAYLKNCKDIKLRVEYPKVKSNKFISTNLSSIILKSKKLYFNKNGSRKEALYLLSNSKEIDLNYEKTKRRIDVEHTMLSPYIKYGVISIVEVYNYFINHKCNELLREIHFRNYYFLIRKYSAYHGYDHYDSYYKNVNWSNSYSYYKTMWLSCNTGYPIIDACVRKLKKTGWLNNRSNLLVAFFSVKILHIDPFNKKIGGQIEFSKNLIYCCYANNYCNWNFILSIFDWGSMRFNRKYPKAGRIFDVTNIKKLDPELKMIREYVDELKDVPDKDVFDWYNTHTKYKSIKYKPIVNWRSQIKIYEELTKL